MGQPTRFCAFLKRFERQHRPGQTVVFREVCAEFPEYSPHSIKWWLQNFHSDGTATRLEPGVYRLNRRYGSPAPEKDPPYRLDGDAEHRAWMLRWRQQRNHRLARTLGVAA